MINIGKASLFSYLYIELSIFRWTTKSKLHCFSTSSSGDDFRKNEGLGSGRRTHFLGINEALDPYCQAPVVERLYSANPAYT